MCVAFDVVGRVLGVCPRVRWFNMLRFDEDMMEDGFEEGKRLIRKGTRGGEGVKGRKRKGIMVCVCVCMESGYGKCWYVYDV